MHKFSIALGAIIAMTAMMAIPTTNFHVAVAYSCSGSSSSGTSGSTTSHVTGNQGSCSTSSSSTGPANKRVGATCLPNFPSNCDPKIATSSSSTSSGGSRTTCSSSHADGTFVFSSSQRAGCWIS